MSRAFLDTAYILAILNPRDELHAKAVALSRGSYTPLVTTEAVLTEVADALCQPPHRTRAVEAIDDLRAAADLSCVSVDGKLFAHGLELYRERQDKDWSLTDCISFVVMRDERIHEALTADIHFVQAGFRALLRD